MEQRELYINKVTWSRILTRKSIITANKTDK